MELAQEGSQNSRGLKHLAAQAVSLSHPVGGGANEGTSLMFSLVVLLIGELRRGLANPEDAGGSVTLRDTE